MPKKAATAPAAGDKKKDEEPAKPMDPMSEMYRYRDGTDTTCLVIGAIAAAANGCSIPAFSEIWGRLINALSKRGA